MDGRKPVPLSSSLAALRHFQWLSALVSHVLFRAVFVRVRTTLDLDGRARAVPFMNMAALAYSTLVLLAAHVSPRLSLLRRYRLESLSVPADVCFAILVLVGGAFLDSTRLDCQGLLAEKFLDDGLARQSLAGGASGRLEVDDIDRQCAVSMFMYWISMVAVTSYTLAILVTLVRLKWYRKLLALHRKMEKPGHVELAIEALTRQGVERIVAPPGGKGSASRKERGHRHERPTSRDSRSSQDTASSHKPDVLLRPDGPRAAEEPPAFASRPPPSLPSYKGD